VKNPEHLQLLPFDGFLGVINDESRLGNTANDQISGSQVDYKIVERRSQVFVRIFNDCYARQQITWYSDDAQSTANGNSRP